MRRNNNGSNWLLLGAAVIAGAGFYYVSRKKKIEACYDAAFHSFRAQALAQGVHGRVPVGDVRRANEYATEQANAKCGDPSKPFGVI